MLGKLRRIGQGQGGKKMAGDLQPK
jgi:hypothetical protein